MKFEINKVVRKINLGDRAIVILMPKGRLDRLKEKHFPKWLLELFPARYENKAEEIWVWTNPPRSLRWKLSRAVALAGTQGRFQEAAEDLFGALAEIWSQHEVQYSKEDVEAMALFLIDQDQGFWYHLLEETLRLISEEMESAQKK